jgi:DNA polymerase
MFKVPVEKIKRGNPEYALRAKGKVAVLACGFGGGAAALERMGAVKMGVALEELPGLVQAWRKANPNIVRLWADVEDAATETVETGRPHYAARCEFKLGPSAVLRIQLPSGRSLSYQNARLGTNKWGRSEILYDGIGQERKNWGELSTYGGKLTENIVQAIARDCLAVSMLSLTAAGYRIVMHVHDEVILDAPHVFKNALQDACGVMGREISWAPGLPLCAAGFECEFYQKD